MTCQPTKSKLESANIITAMCSDSVLGLAMKEMFTFQNLPMVIIITLVVVAWLSFLSVVL